MQKIILDFLESHPLLKMESICKEVKIPLKTITKAKLGIAKIPDKHLRKILEVLHRYDGFNELLSP